MAVIASDDVLDPIVFGDNQFFGVNHMSEEKARAQLMRFSDDQAIIDTLDEAYRAGIRTFMCTTHDRMEGICDHFRRNAERYPDYRFFPCMPYAHKYANAVTEHGILGALQRFLPKGRGVQTLIQGGTSLVSKDVEEMGRLLVDAEMQMFRGLNTPVVFIQNVVTDLLLGLRFRGAFKVFADHVRDAYGAEPGFITMNLPLLLDRLGDEGIENPIVCANINKIGFRMSGGVDAYEALIDSNTFRPMAMSVFASGAIAPREALEYIAAQDNIRSFVFGASSASNIRSTVDTFRSLRDA
jgi:hypothetical protein